MKVSFLQKKKEWGRRFLGGRENEGQHLKSDKKTKMGSLDLGMKKMKSLGCFPVKDLIFNLFSSSIIFQIYLEEEDIATHLQAESCEFFFFFYRYRSFKLKKPQIRIRLVALRRGCGGGVGAVSGNGNERERTQRREENGSSNQLWLTNWSKICLGPQISFIKI